MAAPSFLEALRQNAKPASGVAANPSAEAEKANPNYAVVDTNAIIKGMRLEQLGAQAVTIQEVIDEVRDSQSRHVLDTLPFGISVREADEESYAAVKRFARQTGDITVLSSVDMKVIALAYMLEKAAHGTANLRDKPARPKVQKKGAKTGMKLPGWDFVPNPSDWDALEKEDEEAAARLAAAQKLGQTLPEEPQQHASSRILSGLQALNIASGAAQLMGAEATGRGAAEPAAAAAAAPAAGRAGETSAPAAAAAGAAADGGAATDGAEDEDDGEGEWETACSRTSRVRKMKKASRKAEWEARRAQEEAEAAARAAEQAARAEEEGEEEGEEEEEEEEGEEEGDVAWDEPEDKGSDSSVILVTADFAMQNTALQMGLRLVAPDGMRITRLQRWVLRCHACTAVSRQLERHFCDRCGNAAMDRVVLTVDSEGVEHVGVRRRHRLRGTRYSLPAPKGGRYAVNPILREDQLNMKRVASKGNRRGPQNDDDDGVFAVEFNQDKLFERSGNAPPLINAGKAPIVGRMRNPNERKNKMLNRRR